jgi:serine O-acetyltransferase
VPSIRSNKLLNLFFLILIRLLSDELSVELLGGIFKIKTRINLLKDKLPRKIFIKIYYSYLSKYCCYIGYTAIFDDEPILPHGFFGIFISRHAKIGKNCVIFPNVIIGSNTIPDSKRKGSPTIGNNVYIGAGASIIGNVSIGDNCRIGSNCTITRDIPENSLVIMEKPRIIEKLDMNNKFYAQNAKGCWRYSRDGKKIVETDENCMNQLHEIEIEWDRKKRQFQ